MTESQKDFVSFLILMVGFLGGGGAVLVATVTNTFSLAMAGLCVMGACIAGCIVSEIVQEWRTLGK